MDERTVRELTLAADLPVDDQRLGKIAPQLEAWLAAANELSRMLSLDENRELVPVTVFRHPPVEGGSNER
jgi:hypothetical protein